MKTLHCPVSHLDRRGFTVLEALFVVAITLVLGVAATTLQKDASIANGAMVASLTAQGQMRNVLRTMTMQMRMATNANDGSYPVVTATASEFAFYADIDGDGVREQVSYRADGTDLVRSVIEPAGDPLSYQGVTPNETVIVTDLASDEVFAYYDDSYNGTSAALALPADLPRIRLVRATVSVDRSAFRLPGALTLTAVASLRNVKTNL